MTVPKVAQKQITTAIAAMKQAALGGDEAAAVAETRGLLHLAGPDAATLLHHAIISDTFASPAQRVRAACAILEAGGFLSYETKSVGVFREAEDSDGAAEREAR
jgi:hypothetical protein